MHKVVVSKGRRGGALNGGAEIDLVPTSNQFRSTGVMLVYDIANNQIMCRNCWKARAIRSPLRCDYFADHLRDADERLNLASDATQRASAAPRRNEDRKGLSDGGSDKQSCDKSRTRCPARPAGLSRFPSQSREAPSVWPSTSNIRQFCRTMHTAARFANRLVRIRLGSGIGASFVARK